MFPADLVDALRRGEQRAGLKPGRLCAMVEVETAGHVVEQDGRTPALLYERHIAWRYAAKVSKALQAAFARAGLALPSWSPKTQYKDQGSSAARLALIARARGIDAEVANLSASWGAGQTMGFLYSEMGFPSATAMVEHMTGNLDGQVDCLIKELQNKHLIEPLNNCDCARVARGYNGAGYAQNHYDTKLADAIKRWERKVAGGDATMISPLSGMSHAEILEMQKRLRALGYASVGNPDGIDGSKTTAALAQFQAHEGVPVTGRYDAATAKALASAAPLTPTPARARTTTADLKAQGSKTLVAADHVSLLGRIKVAAATLFGGGAAAEKMGLLETAQGAVDKASQAKGIWESFCDLAGPFFGSPGAIVIVAVLGVTGIAAIWLAECIKAHRLADHISGVHAGPSAVPDTED